MGEAEAEEVARQTRNRNNKENPQKKHCLGTIIEKNQLSSRYYKLNCLYSEKIYTFSFFFGNWK